MDIFSMFVGDFQVMRNTSPTCITSPPLGEVTLIQRESAFALGGFNASPGTAGQSSAHDRIIPDKNRMNLCDTDSLLLQVPPERLNQSAIQLLDSILRIISSVSSGKR